MPILKLSSAANMDLGRTSDLVSDTMSVLGLEIDDLEGYLDVLAQTSRNSNTDVDQLGESFLVVGGKLTQLGVDVEDGAVALGLLADNGIKGSEAGRGLNAILTNLTAPTGRAKEALEELGISAFDSNGEFIGIEETLQLVQDATGDMTQEQQNLYLSMIAGKEHGKTLNALMGELGGGFDNLSGKVSGADGALEEMYDTATDNTMGAINNLRSAIEELGLKIFENLQPAIEKAVEFVQKLTDKFNALTPEQQENIVKIGMMVAAIGPALVVFGKLISVVGSTIAIGGKLIGSFGSILSMGSTLASGLGATVGFIFSPAGAIMVGIAAVIAGGVLLWKNWDLVKEKAGELWVGIKESWNSIKESTSETWNNMKEGTSDSWNNMKESISTKVEEIKSNISGKFGEADLNTALSFSNIGRTISEKLSESDSVVLQKAGSIAGNITDNFDHAYSETGKLFPAIKDTISTTLREADLTVATKMSDIGRSISDNLTDSDNVVMQKAGSILRNITNNFDEAYSETGNSFKAIKMTVSNTMKEAATSAVTKVVEMKNDFTVKFNEIKSNTVTAWNNIKDGIMKPINKAKDAVKTAIDTMKGFFNFEWKLPKIKMPKFSVSGSANPLNWLKDGPPKLNVSWHAKGGILTRPGIFGMMGNTLLAGGEHRTGGEAILPLNRLPKLMADAMEMANRTQRQPMPETVQQRNERPEVNVYQEIHSPKELDARESQRLARINMQQLAYQLGGV